MKNNSKRIYSSSLAFLSSNSRVGWTDKMKERITALEHFIHLKINIISGLAIRNGGRGLIGLLLKYIRAIRPRSSKSVVKQVVLFVTFVHNLLKTRGMKGVVIYLKACQVLLQQSVGRYRVDNLDELKVRPRRTKSGIPKVIPSGARKMIRNNDITTIRLWMTLFGLYRILEFKGKLSLNTITDSGADLSSFIPKWETFLTKYFVPNLLNKIGFLPLVPKAEVFPITKSGPESSGGIINSSPFALVVNARKILSSADLLKYYQIVAINLGVPNIINRIKLAASATHQTIDSDTWKPFTQLPPKGVGYVGKLGFKAEPAGKVRVFAMVDAWTQWLLAPLHSWIFSILQKMSDVDGTFDQMSPVSRLQKLYASKPWKRTFSSIDLSAATDRLPVSLQVSLLKVILKDRIPDSSSFASAWANLLVQRAYQVPSVSRKRFVYKSLPSDLLYKVGQPMGALSSWAMLALTHHAIVQFAAYRAGFKGWNCDYAVLGDDICISHGRIAFFYRKILQEIGVSAGLAKSIISKSRFVVEFAKKFFVNDTTANMLPFKEVIATSTSTSLVLEFVRKYNLSLNAILSLLGYGYKAKSRAVHSPLFSLSTRLRVYLVWLRHPSSSLGYKNFTSWLFMKSWVESFEPSVVIKLQIIKMIKSLLIKRLNKLFNFYESYQLSIKKAVKQHDSLSPMSVLSRSWTGMGLDANQGYSKVNVSWSHLLSSDLSEEIDADYYVGENPVSDALTQITDITLGVELKEFNEYILDLILLINTKISHDNLDQHLENLLIFWFKDDPITSQLPKEFWPTARPPLKKFTDFLEIYKFWQELTKPVWREYYKTRRAPMIKADNPITPDEDKEAEFYDLRLIPDRGDLERVDTAIASFDMNRYEFNNRLLKSTIQIKESNWDIFISIVWGFLAYFLIIFIILLRSAEITFFNSIWVIVSLLISS